MSALVQKDRCPPLSEEIYAALARLFRAACYAADVSSQDPWQYSIEWELLREQYLEPADVRWLVARNLVKVREETSRPGAFRRDFASGSSDCLTGNSALLLTQAGIEFCLQFTSESKSNQLGNSHEQTGNAKPQWDAERHELRFQEIVVKRFRVAAVNQELILTAFHEEGWPEVIDDPLPPRDECDPNQRLQATIKALNRNQTHKLLRFGSNGRSQVFWQPMRLEEW